MEIRRKPDQAARVVAVQEELESCHLPPIERAMMSAYVLQGSVPAEELQAFGHRLVRFGEGTVTEDEAARFITEISSVCVLTGKGMTHEFSAPQRLQQSRQ